MENRTLNSVRNSSIALLAQIISIALCFVSRTVFIKTLDADYLGVNGLFASILSMLSFAELGIGTAIIYALYKPLAENNEKKISALMNFYAKAYRVIGITIGISGLAILPFLDYLIKDQPNIPYLTLIYIIFLANSVMSYFFSYKRSIIVASQKGYINSLNQVLYLIIQNIAQIIVLLTFKQYILYLLIQTICTLMSNVAIANKADKMFPYLKCNHQETIDKETKTGIFKNTLAMVSNKVGSIVVSGTDNLLIAAFVGVYWVGIYSNYVLILSTLSGLVIQITNAVTASVGNLTATENKEKSYDIFKKMLFINSMIAIFCAIELYIILNPFIKFWIGENFLLKKEIVSAIVLNFFIIQMRQPAIVFINTYGLFWQIKWKSLIEAAVNLSASLLFIIVFDLGILGVLFGTIISNLFTNIWWEPFTVYKYKFNVSLKKYFYLYLGYSLTGLTAMLATVFCCSFLDITGLLELVVKTALCLIIPSGVIFIAFNKTDEFKYSINLIRYVLTKVIKNE